MKKLLSILLVLAMVLSFIPVIRVETKAAVPTFTQDQYDIAGWADYYYNMTWECQKTVYGWREQYTFYEGESYRIPYAQAVNSGAYVGYGISYEDFLVAAADPDNAFYTKQSEWSGWVSVYYGTDCAAFVASCWGTFRHDCSTFQYTSTEIATLTADTVDLIELGDALDSYCMGHVVLVSDLIYDDDGNLTHIEITEQTPPQLKRTLHTPESLVAKYGKYYIIYRYEGSVPTPPETTETSDLTQYASHCELQTTKATVVMDQPDASATQLGTATAGQKLTGTRLVETAAGELWYRIAWDGGEGYVIAEDTIYLDQILDDLTLTGATFPQSHVKGNTFSVTGTLSAKYNSMTDAAVKIYSGFGQTGTYVTGGTDTVTGNTYTLKNSTIDYATAFNNVSVGRNTYVVSASYKNYYVKDGQILQNTGTVDLAEEYFRTVSQTVSGCGHSYSSTVMSQADCEDEGKTVYDCATCGNVYSSTTAALGHSYGDWTQVDAQCAAEGSKTRTCATCGHEDAEIIPANGHSYEATEIPADCVSSAYTEYTCSACGHSYKVYPEAVMSDWLEVKPDVDESLIQTKVQYRYRDAETILSEEETLEGYDNVGYEWQTVSTGTNDYVSDWPSGFDKTHSYYTEYTDFVVEHQDGNQRLYLDGQPTTGFFYYHWCNSGYTSSSESKTSTYNTFHVFYSTTNPNDLAEYDDTDDSYKFHNDVCSNSDWYFVAYVSTQQYTIKQKYFLQAHWTDWSEWSETAEEATATHQVEERTLYRYADPLVGEHSYGEWTLTQAPGCVTQGTLTRTCVDCGYADTQGVAATGHSYDPVAVDATCVDYAHTEHICSVCGDSYKEYTMSDWVEALPEGVDAALVQTKTQYRYSDAETITSYESSVEGYEQTGWQWTLYGTDKVQYVPSWPAGFDTTNALYAQYDNAGNKMAAYELEEEKMTIDSDSVGGYLYYHWCSASDANHYSYANKSSTHNIFHAYYSTVAPGNYTCDPSDMSYKTSDSTCSNGNSLWFFVTEVYDQVYSVHKKQYTHSQWNTWSDWSDEEPEVMDGRKIEERTVYSYPVGEYGDHSWEGAVCTLCGETRELDYYLFGWINGANYACEEDYENMGIYQFVDGKLVATFESDSYVAIKTTDNAAWYMAQSYIETTSGTFYDTATGASEKMFVPGGVEVTFTLTENEDGSLTLSYTVTCEHPGHDVDGKCTECGVVIGHDYETVTVDPTCTVAGSTTYTCPCGHSYTEAIPATGHSYEAVTVDPTCTEDGTTTYTCACGDTYSEVIHATGHSYEATTVDATCTEDGTTTYTCACGDTYSETIPATGHSYEATTTDATCTEGGTTTYTCACGDSYTETVPALGHSYEATTIDPTCTEDGAIVYTCVCGDSYSETIPSLGHSYESVTVDPTCTQVGSITYTCACGDSYVEEIPTVDHSYETVTVEPGCTEEGSITDTCTVCGDVQTQILEALGHSYDPVQIDATCVDLAHTEYVCSACGDSYKEYTMSDWVETLPEGVDQSLVQSKVQYRYADTETITSAESSVEGYEQIGWQWAPVGTDKVQYVASWPAGFDTTNALYAQYDNASNKVAEHETESEKLTIDSDAVGGYLYYHWCSASDTNHYSYANKSATHTIFHAYYSTVAPGNYACDTSDMSYKTSDATCSNGNSLWFFVAEVYDQSYTISQKEYTHQKVGQWSDWSDEAPETLEGRIVEERTLYSYPVGEYGDHSWDGTVCTLCGETRELDYYLFGWINGANYACEEDYENMGVYQFVDGKLVATFESDSYVAVKTTDNAVWYMAQSYVQEQTATLYDTNTGAAEKMFVPGGVEVTFTLTENEDGSLTLSYTVPCFHDSHDLDGNCIGCGAYVGHSYEATTTDPTCTVDGSIVYTCACGHTYSETIPATGHSYESVTTDATCTEDGAIVYTCACGDTYSETIPALGHSYESVTTDPTCTEDGSIVYTCACGDSYSETIPATGHSYEATTTDATCTEDGSIVYTCACGDSYSETIPATGHSYGDWTITQAPTCEEAGQMVRACTGCGIQQTAAMAAIGHSYVDGACEYCGAEEQPALVQPTLTLKYPSLSFESEILYNVYYIAEDLDDVVEMGLATFDSELTDGTVDNATDVIPGFETDGSMWKVGTNGISAKNLGDALYFKVYAKLSDGSYVYSAMKSYSAVNYANTILNRSTSSSYMKSLVVAMLNYGTEAQLFFDHNTESLMNAGLTADQQALVSAYDESMMDPVTSLDSAKVANFVYDGSSFTRRAPSVSFDGAFGINYYFTAANAPDDGMTLYYWNIADYTAADVLTTDNATGSMEMVATDVENQYWGQVSGIAAKELDYTVFVVGVYECDGVTYNTGILNYSIGKYCEGIAANDASTQQAFAQATAVYGYCAKEYFANL